MSKYAHHVAAVLATAPPPTAEVLDVLAANLAKTNRNDPRVSSAKTYARAVASTPVKGYQIA